MIEKICNFLTNKIRKEMPDLNEERLEVINYGLQLIIGEIPKMFLAVALALLLGSVKLVLITLLVLIPYRGFTGGFHLKTHIGCFICTTIMYSLPAILGKLFPITGIYEYAWTGLVFTFSLAMITIYAPADTTYLPILTKKERKLKKHASYTILIICIIVAIFIKDSIISNVILYTILMQTIAITKPAYKLSRCEYGYRNMVNQN